VLTADEARRIAINIAAGARKKLTCSGPRRKLPPGRFHAL
jgi:hypothetical protein